MPTHERQSGRTAFAPIDFRTRFPALDGIRALAIVGVFAEHYGGGSHGGLVLNAINTVRGRGWLGVDLFFVLSGFLITGILYDTLGDSRYFQRFFARRSLRIFPVYYAVFVLLLLLTPWLHYQWRPGHALFLVYLGNFLGNYNFDYYTIFTGVRDGLRIHPGLRVDIGHFWSLCVEEQFYFLWPVAVFLLRTRRRILAAAFTLCAVAFALRCVVVTHAAAPLAEQWIVRTLPFRMDALLAGAVLALLLRGPNADKVQRGCKAAFLLGAAATLSIFWLSPDYDSPWLLTIGYTVIALACAGLIGSTLRLGGPAFRLFHLRPLRVLGKYSYGFYIYHLLFRSEWIALLVYLQHKTHSLAVSGVIALSLNFALTFAVSKLSYDLFESKILRFKRGFEYDAEVRTHRHAFRTE